MTVVAAKDAANITVPAYNDVVAVTPAALQDFKYCKYNSLGFQDQVEAATAVSASEKISLSSKDSHTAKKAGGRSHCRLNVRIKAKLKI